MCEGEVDTERQILPSRVVLNMTQRQSLPSCVVLYTTEMQTQMEVCEEMMRGMPRCSKQKWRCKTDLKKTVGGF